MKRIILCISLFAFFGSQAQQINPVPDYVFSNKMSVGRNAVTDTAAYFSIGPRYGAIRGMMPPMVTDTASMSATKRNGLLIFSIQKNKYLYWDSVGAKWAEMAGTAGSAITGSGVAGYMPEFTTSTNLDTTRLYHSAGRFAIGSTTTTNGVFNVYSGQSYMDSTLKIGKGELIVGSTSSASRKLYVTSNSDVARFEQTASDKNMVIELRHTNPNASGTIREESINFLSPNTLTQGRITFYPSDTFNVRNYLAFFTPSGSGSNAERMRIANDGNVGIGTTSPASIFHVQTANQEVARFVSTSASGPYMAFQQGSTPTTVSLLGSYPAASGGGALFTVNDFMIRAQGNMIFSSGGAQERMVLNSNGELLINTTTDAGAYALQVAGAIYNTTGAALSVSSGSVGIGTASPDASFKLDTRGVTRLAGNVFFGISSSTNSRLYILNATNDNRGEIYFDGTNNRFAISSTYGGGGSYQPLDLMTGDATAMRIKADGEVLIGTTTDAGAYALQVAGSIYNTTTITTGAPTGGSIKPWRLGEAATVSPTSPNRTIRVEIDGTVYYIHAKTTND